MSGSVGFKRKNLTCKQLLKWKNEEIPKADDCLRKNMLLTYCAMCQFIISAKFEEVTQFLKQIASESFDDHKTKSYCSKAGCPYTEMEINEKIKEFGCDEP